MWETKQSINVSIESYTISCKYFHSKSLGSSIFVYCIFTNNYMYIGGHFSSVLCIVTLNVTCHVALSCESEKLSSSRKVFRGRHNFKENNQIQN